MSRFRSAIGDRNGVSHVTSGAPANESRAKGANQVEACGLNYTLYTFVTPCAICWSNAFCPKRVDFHDSMIV
jgi:hypothetical protein